MKEMLVNPSAVLLENIFMAFASETFSKNKAAWIVGGEEKLLNLIAQGKIEAVKVNSSKTGKWYCNAADVLRHCRDMRRGTKRKKIRS